MTLVTQLPYNKGKGVIRMEFFKKIFKSPLLKAVIISMVCAGARTLYAQLETARNSINGGESS